MGWSDDDALWAAFDPVLFTRARAEAAPAEIDQVLALAGVTHGDALDLCCGPGRHVHALVRRGFRVTGVDRTRRYLDRARALVPDAELVEADMRDFRREAAFDLVVNLWSAFGYFDDDADEARVLGNVRASLRPGGAFVLELHGKEVLARTFQPRSWWSGDDGSVVCEDRRVVDDWRRIESTWTLFSNGQRFERNVRIRSYSAGELRRMLADARFTHVRCFGSLAGVPYDENALRLVILAT